MSESGIAFEERVQGDRADLVPLLGESFSGIYLWHARRILSGGATVLAARRNGTAVGVAMVKMLDPGTGYVYYIAVARAERRRGTGGLLLDRAIARLVARGSTVILACVTRANVPSERLMASRGFFPSGFRDLARHSGVFGAMRLWAGMTVAPGEQVTLLSTGAGPR
jgi:L-amino acid N-acyltransferase YncA